MNPINKFIYFLYHEGKNIPKTPIVKICFYHLTFVLEGTFTYYVDGKEYVLEKNDAILLPSGALRQRSAIPDNTKYVVFNYYPTKENELVSTVFLKNAVNQSVVNLLNARPCNIYATDKIDNKISYENQKRYTVLQNIFNCILIELLDSIKQESQNPHISNAIKYINENITNPITLEDVCQAIHLSKSYTTRLFKKEMNSTVSEYINKQKLNIAKSMLTNDDLSLQDVSSNLGFENYCYFSKIFKKQFGISPLKMKKKHN